MTQVKELKTYIVKRDAPIDKYVGYTKETTYLVDERLGTCDCEGFVRTSHCKHLMFKGLLDEFKVDEFVFFGTGVGDCKPKTAEKMQKIALELWEPLSTHFNITDLDIKQLIANPTNPELFNCIEFKGKRNKKTMIVGYIHGILFFVKPE